MVSNHRVLTRVASWPWLGVCLVVLGCSTEKATESSGPGKLSAMNITDNPVMYESEPILPLWGKVGDTTTLDRYVFKDTVIEFREYAFVVPDSVFIESGRIDEINVWIRSAVYGHGVLTVDVYDHSEEEWRTAFSGDPRVPEFHWFPPDSFRVNLSPLSDDPVRSFISDAGELRVRGFISSPRIQLLRYHPDYHTVHLPSTDLTWPQALAVVGEDLWVVLSTPSREEGESIWYDTVHVIDRTGATVRIFGIVGDGVFAITEAKGRVWYTERYGNTIGTIDAHGYTQPQFEMRHLPQPERFPYQYYSDLTWSMGRLWVVDNLERKLRGVLVAPSLDSAKPVIDWSLSFEMGYLRQYRAEWDDTYFLLKESRWISRHNLSKETIATYELPVSESWLGSGWGLGSPDMAWDGEAIWMMHYGPKGFETPALLLSRFYLP